MIHSHSPLMQARKHLQTLLHRFQPSNQQEEEYYHRMLSLLKSDVSPFSRNSFLPGHFTASAFILSPSGKELLLILHSKLKRWLQPGGHVEDSDSNIIYAVLREINEEVGITNIEPLFDNIFDIDIHRIPSNAKEPAHEHFDVRFLFKTSSFSYIAGSDAKAARWYSLSNISEIESDQSVMRAVEKLLQEKKREAFIGRC